MAYMNQDRKAIIAAAIKPILASYGVKGTLAVRHHSTLVLNITSGSIDFIESRNRVCGARWNDARYSPAEGYLSVNPHWYHEHFDGTALVFLSEIMAAMNLGNHDHSDAMTDYFNVGWYVDVNIGQWTRPYQYMPVRAAVA